MAPLTRSKLGRNNKRDLTMIHLGDDEDKVEEKNNNSKSKSQMVTKRSSDNRRPYYRKLKSATISSTSKGCNVPEAHANDSSPSNSSTNAASASSRKKLLPWYTKFTDSDPFYESYMQNEWGMEKRGDVPLFEKLSLEGQQAGLSWRIILNKREAYRKTFFNFDIQRVAKMSTSDVDEIIDTDKKGNDVVVKHRGKIESIINNAQRILEMREETQGGDFVFSDFLWSFVNDQPLLNSQWKDLSELPSKTVESEAMSKELKKRGFKFVGPTTCYSMMQSCGLVIDHPMNSPEWHEAKTRLDKRPGGYQTR